jgi:hypothetical protein
MADVQLTERDAAGSERAVRLVDCDVHTIIMPASLGARLSEGVGRHVQAFGPRIAGAYAFYPRMRNGGYRIDARPEEGFAGSDLGLVQAQLLDEYDMDYAVRPSSLRSCAARRTTGRARSGSTRTIACSARSARRMSIPISP